MRENDTPQMKAFEARLRQWQPVGAAPGHDGTSPVLDRMTISAIHEAGRAQGRKESERPWLARWSIAVALCLGVGIGTLTRQTGPEMTERSRQNSASKMAEFNSPQLRNTRVDRNTYAAMTVAFATGAEQEWDRLPIVPTAMTTPALLTPRSQLD